MLHNGHLHQLVGSVYSIDLAWSPERLTLSAARDIDGDHMISRVLNEVQRARVRRAAVNIEVPAKLHRQKNCRDRRRRSHRWQQLSGLEYRGRLFKIICGGNLQRDL